MNSIGKSSERFQSDSILQEDEWFLALTLAERVRLWRERPRALLHEASQDSSPQDSAPQDGAQQDEDRCQRHLAAWKSQSPFQSEEWLQRRMEAEGLTRAEFCDVLATPASTLRRLAPEPPSWLGKLASAFSPEASEADEERCPAEGLSVIVEPLMRRSWAKVKAQAKELVRTYGVAPFDPDRAPRFLFGGMHRRLDRMMSRTVLLEIQVRGLQGHFQGRDLDDTYYEFLDALKDPSTAIAFFREYPVLARIVVEALELWETTSVELLSRLCQDWPQLSETFFGGVDPGSLEAIRGDSGDRHRGGRSVQVLQFASGQQLVYKPRSLAIDIRFEELLQWITARGGCRLRVPKTLDRGPYGWSHFELAEPGRTQEEVSQFYYRQGALLALLHALNANDLHRENIIAARDHPVVIDLESLCGADYRDADAQGFDSVASFELANSVLRVMLLPYLQSGENKEGVDLSGLGGSGGQRSLVKVARWKRQEKGEVRLVRERRKLAAAQNRPRLGAEEVDPLDFSHEIVSGFSEMYDFLVRHRDGLLAADGPLERLENAEVRAIFRATQFYALILQESHHPEVLRDALDRDRLFDRLWFGMDRTTTPDISRRLIPSEHADLWRGDIPCFYTEVASRHVEASDGRVLPDVFRRSGSEMTRYRLENLGEDDLKQQIWLIQCSLAALAPRGERSLAPYVLTRKPSPVTVDRLERAAAAVGDRLRALARIGEDEVSWIGLEPMQSGWQLRPLSLDLYSGLPGIVLFLAWLGEVLGQEENTELAAQTLRSLRRRLQKNGACTSLGAFDGWSGLLYVWTQLGCLWHRDDLLDEALSMLPSIEALIEADDKLDVTSGSAGGIPPLLGLHRQTGSKAPLHLAQRLGNRLLVSASRLRSRSKSRGEGEDRRVLAGFSHGASGAAWALLELYGATQDSRYRQVAAKALAYERHLFSPEAANWPDLRQRRNGHRGQPRFMAAWCHGACGIGLSRLRMRQHLQHPVLGKDLKAALEATLQQGFGSNHSLCHGDLGSLELLLEASRTLAQPRWQHELHDSTSRVLASIEEHGYRCGIPVAAETPGLMEGLAGIGYGLLRLAAPDRVPSVLLLDPPPSQAVPTGNSSLKPPEEPS